jgi:hypothetical protein
MLEARGRADAASTATPAALALGADGSKRA